jgi:hypothetical protein
MVKRQIWHLVTGKLSVVSFQYVDNGRRYRIKEDSRVKLKLSKAFAACYGPISNGSNHRSRPQQWNPFSAAPLKMHHQHFTSSSVPSVPAAFGEFKSPHLAFYNLPGLAGKPYPSNPTTELALLEINPCVSCFMELSLTNPSYSVLPCAAPRVLCPSPSSSSVTSSSCDIRREWRLDRSSTGLRPPQSLLVNGLLPHGPPP